MGAAAAAAAAAVFFCFFFYGVVVGGGVVLLVYHAICSQQVSLPEKYCSIGMPSTFNDHDW